MDDDLQPVRDPLPDWELAPHRVSLPRWDAGRRDAGTAPAPVDGGPDAGLPDAGRPAPWIPSDAGSDEEPFDDDDEADAGVDAGRECGTDGGLITCSADCWCSGPSLDASGPLVGVGVGATGEAWAIGSTLLHYDGSDLEDVPTGRRQLGTVSDAFAGVRRPQVQGTALWVAGPEDIWVARGARLSHWDGRQFQNLGSTLALLNTVVSIWGSSPSDLWAVGPGGTLARGDGNNWSTSPSGTTESLTAVWGSNARDVWIVGTNGALLHFDGTNLEPVDSGTSAWLTGVWVSPSGELWVSGNGGLWRGGRSGLRPVPLGGDFAFASIWGDGQGRVWAVGTLGTILRFDGQGWRSESSGTRVNLHAVSGGGGRVFVAGDSGVLLWHVE